MVFRVVGHFHFEQFLSVLRSPANHTDRNQDGDHTGDNQTPAHTQEKQKTISWRASTSRVMREQNAANNEA
jgi:hypothetical protein